MTMEEAIEYTGHSERFLKSKINSGEIAAKPNGKMKVSDLNKFRRKMSEKLAVVKASSNGHHSGDLPALSVESKL